MTSPVHKAEAGISCGANRVSIVDLSAVSSVVSNVSASPPSTSSSTSTLRQKSNGVQFSPSGTNSSSTPQAGLATKPLSNPSSTVSTSTRITIHGYIPHTDGESVLLQLYPQTHTLASEWLDGLLMLLNQQPITADTNKLVHLIGGYGLKIRLLNVRFDDEVGGGQEVKLPDREGLDEEYWYDIGGMG